MMPAAITAWRFLHPDFDRSAVDTGVAAASGLQVDAGGRVELVQGPAAVRQGLLLLLSTTPGERVMRQEWGCDLQQLVFAPNDDTTAGLAIHHVRQAITRFEPRVVLLSVDAHRVEDEPGQLEIVVEYRLKTTLELDRLSFRLDLT
jgi:Bacteriophage baseplate protein W